MIPLHLLAIVFVDGCRSRTGDRQCAFGPVCGRGRLVCMVDAGDFSSGSVFEDFSGAAAAERQSYLFGSNDSGYL